MEDIIVRYMEGASKLERHGAWIDLACSEDVSMKQGDVRIIPFGINVKMPEGFEGIIAPRSSTCLKHGILMANSIGIIEKEYCGNDDVWGFVAYAVRDTFIPAGTRIAQFRIQPMMPEINVIETDDMGCASRGGYGSTGEYASEVDG